MVYVEVGSWSDTPLPSGAVVVGWNGGAHSDVALSWATAAALAARAPLVVLYAANYPGMTGPEAPGLFERDPAALEAAEEVTARGVGEALRMQSVLHVFGATEVDSPARALVEASREASLVVLGSRGHGQVVGALLGSVAFNVAARAECPVVVVKDESASRTVGPDHRVVVGTDGSEHGSAAVTYAAERAAAASADLEIVTCTGGHQVEPIDEDVLRANARRSASTAADHVRGSHPQLSVATTVEDCPAERTLVALSADAGLVVVGTRGRGAFQGMLLGSVSHAVIYGASCAVAVVDTGAVATD